MRVVRVAALRTLGARAFSVAAPAQSADTTTTTATVGIDLGTESVRAVVVSVMHPPCVGVEKY